MPRYICVPNLKFLGTLVPNLWMGSKSYKFCLWTPNTPPLGEFCYMWDRICEDLSVHKIENLMFLAIPVQNLWKRVQNLHIWPWTPPHPHLGEFCYPWDGTCQHLSVYQIWSLWLYPFQIYEFRYVTAGVARSGYAGFKKMTSLARAEVAGWFEFVQVSTKYCCVQKYS